jgi:hypothetical protein
MVTEPSLEHFKALMHLTDLALTDLTIKDLTIMDMMIITDQRTMDTHIARMLGFGKKCRMARGRSI